MKELGQAAAEDSYELICLMEKWKTDRKITVYFTSPTLQPIGRPRTSVGWLTWKRRTSGQQSVSGKIREIQLRFKYLLHFKLHSLETMQVSQV